VAYAVLVTAVVVLPIADRLEALTEAASVAD
jgi:hypothetical protein